MPRSFSTPHGSFLCGVPIYRKLDQLRNQSVFYPKLVLSTYDSLGQNLLQVINIQNTKLIILPSVTALKYAFRMEMFKNALLVFS